MWSLHHSAGSRKAYQAVFIFQPAFPKNGETADHLHYQESLSYPSLKNVPEFISVSHPNGPGAGASDLEWTGKGVRVWVRVCARKSLSLFQTHGKVTSVFHENHPKTTFFFSLLHHEFPGPQSPGTSRTLEEPHQKRSSSLLPFRHPEAHSLIPASQIFRKETWRTHAHARAHARTPTSMRTLGTVTVPPTSG